MWGFQTGFDGIDTNYKFAFNLWYVPWYISRQDIWILLYDNNYHQILEIPIAPDCIELP